MYSIHCVVCIGFIKIRTAGLTCANESNLLRPAFAARCSQCFKTFTTKEKRLAHAIAEHDKVPAFRFKCRICARKFKMRKDGEKVRLILSLLLGTGPRKEHVL